MLQSFPTKCRLVNDMLQIRERKKEVFRREPVKRAHGEIVVLTLTKSKLPFEVIKGIKFMGSIKFFVVLSVTAFHFSIVSWSEWTNQLMLNPQFF